MSRDSGEFRRGVGGELNTVMVPIGGWGVGVDHACAAFSQRAGYDQTPRRSRRARDAKGIDQSARLAFRRSDRGGHTATVAAAPAATCAVAEVVFRV